MPDRKLKVFLSSTAKDLTAFRKAVHARLAASPLFECIRQEEFGAQPDRRKQVLEADLFIGLIGMRRGWEPTADPDRHSITEMEYDWAKDVAPRFMHVTPNNFPVPGDLRETDDEHQRQLAFRQRVMSELVVSQNGFSSPEALANSVLDQLTLHALAGEEQDDDDIAPAVLQRPAAFLFGLRDNKIDALPETAETSDREIAKDLYSELLAKARELEQRLARSNADRRTLDSVVRLLNALGTKLDDVRPGLLLSRSRSIEADRNAFDTPKGRRELFPDAISMIDDLLLSARDLLAVYPVVRQIEIERLALDVQRDSKTSQIIRRDTDAIKRAATDSDAVTREGMAALKEHDVDIDTARNSGVRANLIADHLLVVRNFASETLRAVRSASALAARTLGRPLNKAGSELRGLSTDSWQQVREHFPKGIGRVVEAAPTGALVALLITIAGPIGGLGILRGGGFKELAKAIGKFAGPKVVKKKKPSSSKRTRETRKTILGHAQILEIFSISKAGKIAGCRVTDGHVERDANVRLIRDNAVIHEGKLSQLRRFKEEVNEVVAGQECGMALENFQDLRQDDVIECYRLKRVQRSL